MKKSLFLSIAALCCFGSSSAQLNSNPDKFLGNITTSYQVDYGAEKFYTLWNQITCENESKWGSVEGNNNTFNWGCDNAVKYAKSHNFPFKFHALVWGAQYPKWIESQKPEQRYKEIVQWMDEVKKKYPDLQLIDVVNEALDGHQPGTPYFIEALGGKGKTGYDWLIKAFELAYERWPNAILIYNDFNTFQWNTDQYIDLVKTLRNAGAPIDAYGCQSHDLTDCSFANFKSAMTKLQSALKMPMYSTEYDIATEDDNLQLQRYKEQIPYMWEMDYVAGVTLWGYIYGKTWTKDGNSGIIKNGKDRPAMTWLREYMQSDKAKQAKSPFPGMVKEASVYIKPEALTVEKGTETSINVRAKMRTKTIEKVELYAKNMLLATMTEEPYITTYTPTATGDQELKAVVTCTDGETYTRYSMINVCNARSPFKTTLPKLPGTLQMENFDKGGDGIAFHDTNSNKEGDGASYRTDAGGIDVVKGGSGYAVGYTQAGEWMEYTVNIDEPGYFTYSIYYSAPKDGTKISLSLSTPDGLVPLTKQDIELPSTNAWGTYKTFTGHTNVPIEAGEQIIRVTIVSGNDTYITNLDRIKFESFDYVRTPYDGEIQLPGVLEVENFDKGGEDFTFHDSDSKDEGKSGYRTDNEGVDIKKFANGEYGIGWTAVGEWTEYSVNVAQAGRYSCEAVVSSTTTGGIISVVLNENDKLTTLWKVSIPKTGEGTFRTVRPAGTKELTEGPHIFRISVVGANGEVDKLIFNCTEPTAVEPLAVDETNAASYNLQGQRVGADFKGIVIKGKKKYFNR